jgi:flavin reductase (DIM6/NTAB) family NADH-FMN oxidoreductase RutF
VIIDPKEFPSKERYKLLIGSVLPRPIAWVSTMDSAGRLNLAPYSYFTVGAREPMTLLFCPQVGGSGRPEKDTLLNIKQVPEFVINITSEDTAEQMNLSATTLPHGQSEFEWAGVTPAPSQSIRVPRVAEAPIAFECKLQQIVTVSDQPGGGHVVFGEVQLIYFRDDVFVDGYVHLDALKPIGRLAGAGYTKVTDRFEMHRVPPPGS